MQQSKLYLAKVRERHYEYKYWEGWQGGAIEKAVWLRIIGMPGQAADPYLDISNNLIFVG